MAILSSAESTLRGYVVEMLQNDNRFVGMSRYVHSIKFFWNDAIKTACAGHGFIFFNPNFWDSLASDEHKKSVIAHEIWHLILDHLERGKGYDPDSHNRAADHVINNGLLEDGFVMGPNVMFGDIYPCCDPKYKGWSTEQVYADIHNQRKKDPTGFANAQTGKGLPHETTETIEDLVQQVLDGEAEDGVGRTSEPMQQVAEKNSEAAAEAREKGANAEGYGGRSYGNNPGGQDRILKYGHRIFMKEASYDEIFEDYLTDPLSSGKRTFMRPARRQLKGGLRIKGRMKKGGPRNRLKHLAYCLDVSGSITEVQANQFLSSAATIKGLLKPRLMTIMLWDTEIKFEKVFREDEELDNIRVKGGGGTNLSPVYRRLSVLQPEAAVIFTDFQVSIPAKPEWETIWFGTSRTNHIQHVGYGDIYLIPEK